MGIKLKSIILKNYKGKGTYNFHADFGNVTRISGRNKSGKSSVMDAYLDVLTGKLADGSEPNSVRPHDKNGNDLNRDDVVRELIFDIDGMETTVKKVTSQKWVKERGTMKEVFKGNQTKYVIDGFESSNQKAFTEWQEKIAKADVLLMCSNARPFLNTVQKSTAEARKILENLAGFSTEKFIAENPKYAHIAEITKNHKIEDVSKQLRRDLSAQKKVAGEAKVKLDYERAREISVEGGIEIAELELLINGLKEKIAELDKQETVLDEAVKAYDEASSGVLELKFELSDLERTANEENSKKRSKIQSELDTANCQYDREVASASGIKARIKDDEENELPRLERRLRNEQVTWKNVKLEQIEEKSYFCPTCHREFSEEQRENILSNYEENKKKRLDAIVVEGNKASQAVKDKKKYIEDSKKELAEHEARREALLKKIEELEEQLEILPQSIDISDTEEYKTIQSQIAKKEAALNAINNHSEKRAEIKAERQQLIDEISEKKAVILKYQADVEQREKNVSALESDLRNKNQCVADTEQKIELLKDFSIEKNKALAEEINPHFKHFQFEFVEYTQEGNPVETLKLMCGGTSYFDGLNLSDRILCEIDLVCGLQAIRELNLPVFVDNTEAINTDRLNDFIKDLPQQIILLKKTSDEKLKVEVV